MTEQDDPNWLKWWGRWGAWLLLALTTAVYLPSLSGEFSVYDDPLLIVNNPLLKDDDAAVVGRMFTDFSAQTRFTLGAEYLPLRDLSHWLEVRAFGLNPHGMRAVNLALYVGACLALRRALKLSLPVLPAEVAALVFSLHPVHAESVAWLAGRKDVLALLFVMLALWAYSQRGLRRWLVLLLTACALTSKSMTVILPGLLIAHDVVARRRPRWLVVGGSLAVAAALLFLHLHVGGMVEMVQEPLGGSRLSAFFSMGPIWLRYLATLVWPPSLSVIQSVEVLQGPTPLSVTGWLVLVGWGGAGLWLWRRRDQHAALATFLWFSVPLVPVSQVIFPLENFMADRYGFLSVLALALAVGFGLQAWWVSRKNPRLVLAALGCAFLLWVPATVLRGLVFADDRALFADAADKAPDSPLASYQLALVLERSGDIEGARRNYHEVLTRSGRPPDARRRAANNLARLYFRQGNLLAARQVLVQARQEFPDDPKLLGNLVKVTARLGDEAGARALYQELQRRFPEYAATRRRAP